MLYWKKNEGSRYGGFYEEEIPGSTPVTQQEVDELIKKQEMGFEIIDDGNGKPISTVPLDSINKESIKRKKILEIKAKLNSTDYQIIKCYEASMRQLPLPYNLEELATQRDAWRAEINQLEQELAELE